MKLVEIICPVCGCKAMKSKAEVTRRTKIGNRIYCSKECANKGAGKTRKIFEEYETVCGICTTTFITSDCKHGKKFCSQRCANVHSQTFTDPQKVSVGMKAAWKRGDFDGLIGSNTTRGEQNIYVLKCKQCQNGFVSKTVRKTCSDECCRNLRSAQATANPNCGGETNYRKNYYKGIWMDSTWEVKIAEYLDMNEIEWVRSRKIMFYWTDVNDKKRRYYPDFYLPKFNAYLDPKNKFLLVKDKFKLEQVVKENNINLVYGSLEKIMNFIDTGSEIAGVIA